MLHEVPDSLQRARLLEVLGLQEQLMVALCALPADAVVDIAWLNALWADIPPEWVERFWNIPKEMTLAEKPGKRALWIKIIAAAAAAEKQIIRDLIAEQLRFDELYTNPPTVRLTIQDWTPVVYAAVNKLLKSFYDPLLYKEEGFPNADGTLFNKEHFINPRPIICPYTDNAIQDTKLDHFLPKDQFPMLSCHPDNLIPCSTDPNSGGHKGTMLPLDPDHANQADDWFHPRRRSAKGTFRLDFPPGPAPQPSIRFIALEAHNQLRLDNMERMFGLSEFWGGFIDDDVQGVASDVSGMLEFDNLPTTEENIRSRVLLLADQARRKIGRHPLAIVKSYFYAHIANTPVLFDQVVRICMRGT